MAILQPCMGILHAESICKAAGCKRGPGRFVRCIDDGQATLAALQWLLFIVAGLSHALSINQAEVCKTGLGKAMFTDHPLC